MGKTQSPTQIIFAYHKQRVSLRLTIKQNKREPSHPSVPGYQRMGDKQNQCTVERGKEHGERPLLNKSTENLKQKVEQWWNH